jgi:transcriptional regulator of arginine metabolism
MNDRQRMITELLDEHEVSTQLQLQRLLARRGHEVTQATVSRDLDRLGVVRVRRHGRLVYALSEEADVAPADRPLHGGVRQPLRPSYRPGQRPSGRFRIRQRLVPRDHRHDRR